MPVVGHDAGMTALRTGPARRWRAADLDHLGAVASRGRLAELGLSEEQVTAQLAADRWRAVGTAIVLHNGPPTRGQRERIATLNCGPRAVLTSFTAAARWGLRGWERDEVHVLAPGGTTRPRIDGVVLHRTRNWSRADIAAHRDLHRLAPSLLLAAASFAHSRPGCGLLAASVQQRLARPADLLRALDSASRLRHRAQLRLAVHDIAQGAQALSEIDLRRLCVRYGLPLPDHQAVRVEPNGRRRYLDATWTLPDGRVVAVEVDGALHLAPRRWVDDQLRQNEVVLGGTLVLRYPSVVVRDEPELVVAQLRRALDC